MHSQGRLRTGWMTAQGWDTQDTLHFTGRKWNCLYIATIIFLTFEIVTRNVFSLIYRLISYFDYIIYIFRESCPRITSVTVICPTSAISVSL